MKGVDHIRVTGKPRKILVTGATGLVGGHVTRYFVSMGQKVSCLVRDSGDRSFIDSLPVQFIIGDITNKDQLARSFAGFDSIIHTAAKVDDWGSYEEFYRVNVEGTLNVLEAAYRNSIKRVIITGSISSYGEENCTFPKNEESNYNSHYKYAFDRIFPSSMNHYRDTKAISTQKATEFAEKHEMDLIVIEPAWVYGENEFNSGFYEYLKTVRSGFSLVPGCRSNSFHVIYARDLAKAYWLAYNSGLKGVHRLIIGNQSPENMYHIFNLFCSEAGFRKPWLLPKALAYPIGFILELIYQLVHSKKPPMLTRARVNMFYDSIGYNTYKADKYIGFKSETPLEVGIRETVNWYRDRQLI